MDIVEELKSKIRKTSYEQRAVSMSVCAFKNDSIIFCDAFGYKNQENYEPANIDTIYRSASVSKTVSAMAAMTLVDQGKLDLDEDIGNYLGYRVRNPYYPDIPITTRQLMTYTSTIYEEGSYSRIMVGELPPYKLSELLPEGSAGYSKENFISARPGEKIEYSSFGVGIMGAIIEKVTGKKFASYAYDSILKPLNIRGSYDPRYLDDSQVASTYEIIEPGDNPKPYGDMIGSNPEWMKKSFEYKLKLMDLPIGEAYRAPQGNLYIVPQDLAKILMVLTNKGNADGKQILSEQSVEQMLTPYMRDPDKDSLLGLNLSMFDHFIEGKRIVSFAGRAYGVLSGYFISPDDKTGVIVYSNGARSQHYAFDCPLACVEVAQIIYDYIDKL